MHAQQSRVHMHFPAQQEAAFQAQHAHAQRMAGQAAELQVIQMDMERRLQDVQARLLCVWYGAEICIGALKHAQHNPFSWSVHPKSLLVPDILIQSTRCFLGKGLVQLQEW